ncbi:hypothetical protein IE077_002915 [Cardiosporidium cionae]|uniref:Uncharacterized protein n=1 Tax=Cardiosporidium cionae TaxID=476202 RepID=A0ABQ7J9Q1_9APIC|nr:hypothetical protein IE077_002915 [Cardiosporidium cionae]|eukprot:KAF8820695.1 hypothetical protein IE077_002915 [Cardiosporidium cionae]
MSSFTRNILTGSVCVASACLWDKYRRRMEMTHMAFSSEFRLIKWILSQETHFKNAAECFRYHFLTAAAPPLHTTDYPYKSTQHLNINNFRNHYLNTLVLCQDDTPKLRNAKHDPQCWKEEIMTGFKRSERQIRAMCYIWQQYVQSRVKGHLDESQIKAMLLTIAKHTLIGEDPILTSEDDDTCVRWFGDIDSDGYPILTIDGHFSWVTKLLAYLFADDQTLGMLRSAVHGSPEETTPSKMACGNRNCIRIDHISV